MAQTGSFASLVPPLLALVVVLATRNVTLALACAVCLGVGIERPTPVGLVSGLFDHVGALVFDAWHLSVLGFAVCTLGMVQILTTSGGTWALIQRVTRYVNSARGAKLSTACMGIVVFFDDYANSMLVGPTARPLTDRFGVSRAKLAYLVDSTAAPVAGVAIISTWIGYEVGLLGDQAQALGLGVSGYALFLRALPHRYYCWFSLTLVFISSAWERDFSPMHRHELAARNASGSSHDAAHGAGVASEPEARTDSPGRASFAIVPIAVLVGCFILGLLFDGGGLPRLTRQPGLALSLGFWRQTLSQSESNVHLLLLASFLATSVALALPWMFGSMSLKHGLAAFVQGAKQALAPLSILLLAWGLGGLCQALGTGPFIVESTRGVLPALLIPLATFLASAAVAFATGTSWGTMAILIPAALPLAQAVDPQVFILTVAAVMDGAIFGDHCSPISDTTVMSSICSGCDLIDHVATQLPYALVAMLAAAGAYLLGALGLPSSVCFCSGVALMVICLWTLGRPLRTPSKRVALGRLS